MITAVDESRYVFAPAAQPVVPVAGEAGGFPVHRIYCVGQNYREHAREMGDSGREPPFFFAKPADAVCPTGTTLLSSGKYCKVNDEFASGRPLLQEITSVDGDLGAAFKYGKGVAGVELRSSIVYFTDPKTSPKVIASGTAVRMISVTRSTRPSLRRFSERRREKGTLTVRHSGDVRTESLYAVRFVPLTGSLREGER